MTYKIQGVTLPLQPESGRWIERDSLGLDGNGKPLYAATRQFEMRWGFMDLDDFETLRGLYAAVNVTGTAVVSLPQWGQSSWTFYDYTGCQVYEPVVDQYFEQHVSNVLLVVGKVRT